MRKLSERTTTSTAEISQLVARFQTEAENLRQLSDIDHGLMAEIEQESKQAYACIDQLLENSKKMVGTIASIALRSFVETAKTDHLVFKQEIYRVFLGVSGKQASDFSDHHHCRLGKWYFEGDGRACFSKLPGYQILDAPHRRVHEHGHHAIAQFHSGRMDEALESLAAMERASMEVLDHLETIAASGESRPEVLCLGH